MATREVKDAKDIKTGELIYLKGHAKATYLSNGLSVEDGLSGKQDVITDLSTIRNNATRGANALQEETDPIFSASPAAKIKANDITNWNNKQDELTSGTNIKTINGESILGSGNIQIQSAQEETDPIFSASPAAGIKTNDITNWNNKQDALAKISNDEIDILFN